MVPMLRVALGSDKRGFAPLASSPTDASIDDLSPRTQQKFFAAASAAAKQQQQQQQQEQLHAEGGADLDLLDPNDEHDQLTADIELHLPIHMKSPSPDSTAAASATRPPAVELHSPHYRIPIAPSPPTSSTSTHSSSLSLLEALQALAVAQAEIAALQAELALLHTEQQAKQDNPGGAVSAHGMSDEGEEDAVETTPTMSLQQYFATPFYLLMLRRMPWLVGLLLLQSFSASILQGYDAFLERHLIFSFYAPMVVGTGGNAGNQCSVMITRALALGMSKAEVLRVVRKETPTAIFTALILGLLAWGRVLMEYPDDKLEAIAIALTLALSILLSIALGILFSVAIGMLNRCDPADGAAPLLSTISDLIGIAILCAVATAMMAT